MNLFLSSMETHKIFLLKPQNVDILVVLCSGVMMRDVSTWCTLQLQNCQADTLQLTMRVLFCVTKTRPAYTYKGECSARLGTLTLNFSRFRSNYVDKTML